MAVLERRAQFDNGDRNGGCGAKEQTNEKSLFSRHLDELKEPPLKQLDTM